ncbi:Na+/H+ antiporter subunit E [Pseudokineococcus sp. 5B2Z-1]|uniref:Na+/H+ antiporter subunit E n=1 Tax=Pseudokineococcus sp. 5B2Z-1 TaxID=3132744 RepID=UPI0030978A04
MSAVGHAGRLVAFAGWYVGRFLAANLVVLREVLTPGSGVAPVVLELVLRCRTDVEVASYIALVGLTPGTLVVSSHDGRRRPPDGPPGGAEDGDEDGSGDGRGDVVVAAHVMHAPDVAEALAELRELETRLLRALRAGPGAVPPPPPHGTVAGPTDERGA